MNIKNSKSIKLKKQQKALKFWRDKGELYIMGNAFLSAVPFAFATSINMGLAFTIFAMAYIVLSTSSICIHMLYGKEKMSNKIKDIDQELLALIKADEKEFYLLTEYDKIETLKNEIKDREQEIENQKRIIEKMIVKNTLEEQEKEIKAKSRSQVKQIKKQVKDLDKEIEEIKEENQIDL